MDYPKLISEKWNLTAKFNCLQAIYFDAPSALAVPMCAPKRPINYNFWEKIVEVEKKKMCHESPPPPPPPAHQLFQDLCDFRGWRRQLRGILPPPPPPKHMIKQTPWRRPC